jgi:hypothetical protein
MIHIALQKIAAHPQEKSRQYGIAGLFQNFWNGPAR